MEFVFCSEKNSKRARDMHLLKKLKVMLKASAVETVTLQTDINEILQDIRIASIRHQVWMVRLVNNSLKRETYMKMGTMGFYIMKCIVHTTREQGTIVFYFAYPVPYPGPVQCAWAIMVYVHCTGHWPPTLCFSLLKIYWIITVRKRSLRRLCFHKCLSVHRGGHGLCLWGVSVPEGVSVQGSLSRDVSVQGGSLSGRPPVR